MFLKEINFSLNNISTKKKFFFSISRSFYNLSKNTFLDMFEGIPYPVDYPRTTNGIVGKDAYMRVCMYGTTVILKGFRFRLANKSPFGSALRKMSRKGCFFIGHYAKIWWRGAPYTVHLMWPVFVRKHKWARGRGKWGAFFHRLPEWHNPYLKGKLQYYYVPEYAFVNLIDLPFYACSFELQDFTKSPFDREEAETYLKTHFFKRHGILPQNTWGFAVYRFKGRSMRYRVPSYIPKLGQAIDKITRPDTDYTKAAMVLVNEALSVKEADELWERWWSLKSDQEKAAFIDHWTKIGIPVPRVEEMEIKDAGSLYLPDGKVKDPEGENVRDYFDKAIDPKSYFLRKEIPPETLQCDTAKEFATEWDFEQDVNVPDLEVKALPIPHLTPREVRSMLATELYWMSPQVRAAIDARVYYLALKAHVDKLNSGTVYATQEEEDFALLELIEDVRIWNGLPTKTIIDFDEEPLAESDEAERIFEFYDDIRAYRENEPVTMEEPWENLFQDWAGVLKEERGPSADEIDWESIVEQNVFKGPPANPTYAKDGFYRDSVNALDPTGFIRSLFWKDPRNEE